MISYYKKARKNAEIYSEIFFWGSFLLLVICLTRSLSYVAIWEYLKHWTKNNFLHCMEGIQSFWKLCGLVIISLSFSCHTNWIFHLVWDWVEFVLISLNKTTVVPGGIMLFLMFFENITASGHCSSCVWYINIIVHWDKASCFRLECQQWAWLPLFSIKFMFYFNFIITIKRNFALSCNTEVHTLYQGSTSPVKKTRKLLIRLQSFLESQSLME